MKTKFAIAAAIAALAVCGCRREDVREFTVELPGVSASDKRAVEAALLPYGGVKKDSFVWDFDAQTLTMRYDSMQIARTNIRMAIEAAGFKPVYPENTTGKAGH